MRDSPIANVSSADDLLLSRHFSEAARENVFAPYRERILYPVAAAASAAFLPLAVHHLLRERFDIAGLLLLLVTMLAADVVALARGRRPPVRFALLMLPGAASVLLAMPEHAIYGAMWAYPTMMFAYFVLPRRLANMTSVSFLGMAATLMTFHETNGTTIRFALSMGFCILVINIILNVLDSVHRRLLALSVVDPLTGAFNRRHMEQALDHALERRRRSGARSSILVIDIDHFKSINDRFGHAAGDHVLRDLVRLVRERSRKLDALFRIGGEEFLMLLPDTGSDDAIMAAEYLRAHVAAYCRVKGQMVTVSIGVAEAVDGDGVDGWMLRADGALYRAKREGRNQAFAA